MSSVLRRGARATDDAANAGRLGITPGIVTSNQDTILRALTKSDTATSAATRESLTEAAKKSAAAKTRFQRAVGQVTDTNRLKGGGATAAKKADEALKAAQETIDDLKDIVKTLKKADAGSAEIVNTLAKKLRARDQILQQSSRASRLEINKITNEAADLLAENTKLKAELAAATKATPAVKAAASQEVGEIMTAISSSPRLAKSYAGKFADGLKDTLGNSYNFVKEGAGNLLSKLDYYKWTIATVLALGLAVPAILTVALKAEEAKRRNSDIKTTAQGECATYCLPVGFDKYLDKTVTKANLLNPKDVEGLSDCFMDDNTCFPTKARLQKQFGDDVGNLPTYYCTDADLDSCEKKCADTCTSQYPQTSAGAGTGAGTGTEAEDEDAEWATPDLADEDDEDATDYTPFIIGGVVVLIIIIIIIMMSMNK